MDLLQTQQRNMGNSKSNLPLHPAKCTVECVLFAFVIVVSVVLEDNVNSELYGKLKEENSVPVCKELTVISLKYFLQQDLPRSPNAKRPIVLDA
jgi:hypothetical protein